MEPTILGQAVAHVSGNFNQAALNWWLRLAPSSLAQWAGAVATSFAVAIALFKDSFLLWRRRPRLSAKCTVNSPWTVLTTIQVLQPTQQANVMAILWSGESYWVRMEVKNHGKTRAEKVQVFASKLAKLSDGKSEDVVDFIPLNFKWSNSPRNGASAVLDGISPEMTAFCDLVCITDPDNHTQQRPKEVPPEVTVAQLQLEVDPSNLCHLLSPGTYKLSLRIAAANAKPVDKTLTFRHAGWSRDELQMKRDLLQVSLL
jgi:hypothetical protein